MLDYSKKDIGGFVLDNKVNRFLNNINTDDIKYVYMKIKTAVFLIEGKSIETWIPMKDIYENL